MGTLFVDKLDPQSGTSLEIGSSGDTITIPSGCTITNNGTQTGFGGVMTPAFQSYKASNQSVSNNTDTLVQYDTEEYDTANAYDTSTYRFTPQTAGKYFVYATILPSGDANSAYEKGFLYVRKNGTREIESRYDLQSNNGRSASCSVSCVLTLNGSSDYVDVYATIDSTGTSLLEADRRFSRFGAFRLIE